MCWYIERTVSEYHQRQPRSSRCRISLERCKESPAVAVVESTDINRKRSADVSLLTEPGRLRVLRDVRTGTGDGVWNAMISGDSLDQCSFFGAVVQNGARAPEHVPE